MLGGFQRIIFKWSSWRYHYSRKFPRVETTFHWGLGVFKWLSRGFWGIWGNFNDFQESFRETSEGFQDISGAFRWSSKVLVEVLGISANTANSSVKNTHKHTATFLLISVVLSTTEQSPLIIPNNRRRKFPTHRFLLKCVIQNRNYFLQQPSSNDSTPIVGAKLRETLAPEDNFSPRGSATSQHRP